jgi:RNA polymerase sigma factor (TIGR02999 family)
MEPDDRSQVTSLFLLSREGDSASLDKLFPLVYDELHRMAEAQFHKERAGHTLQPTAVVHEVYLRLIDSSKLELRDRAHFLALCAGVMRRMLVDYHRSRKAGKRGGDRVRVSVFDATDPQEDEGWDVEALEKALEALTGLDERKARVVELRFFGGLTVDEVATALETSRRTVEADWTFARAWLHRELSKSPFQ